MDVYYHPSEEVNGPPWRQQNAQAYDKSSLLPVRDEFMQQFRDYPYLYSVEGLANALFVTTGFKWRFYRAEAEAITQAAKVKDKLLPDFQPALRIHQPACSLLYAYFTRHVDLGKGDWPSCTGYGRSLENPEKVPTMAREGCEPSIVSPVDNIEPPIGGSFYHTGSPHHTWPVT